MPYSSKAGNGVHGVRAEWWQRLSLLIANACVRYEASNGIFNSVCVKIYPKKKKSSSKKNGDKKKKEGKEKLLVKGKN